MFCEIITLWLAELKEFLLKMAISVDAGQPAPPMPPEVSDQCETSFQFPPLPTQYLLEAIRLCEKSESVKTSNFM